MMSFKTLNWIEIETGEVQEPVLEANGNRKEGQRRHAWKERERTGTVQGS